MTMPILTIPFDDDVVRRLQRKDRIADEYRAESGHRGPVGVDMLPPGVGTPACYHRTPVVRRGVPYIHPSEMGD